MAHLDGRIDPAKDAKPQDRQRVKDGTSGNSAAPAPGNAAATKDATADPDMPGRTPDVPDVPKGTPRR